MSISSRKCYCKIERTKERKKTNQTQNVDTLGTMIKAQLIITDIPVYDPT